MPTRTLIVGNDGANVLQGGASAELIYGFDPNGPQGNTSAIAATRVAAGLAEPVFATAPPGDVGRLFIVEKGGRIQILDLATGAMLAAPFLDITSEVNPFGEQGLLGLAFHPDYATNGLFYVYLSTPSGDAEVRRYQVSAGDPNRADAATAQLVTAFDYPATSANHRAGWIGFGPTTCSTSRPATAASIRGRRSASTPRSARSCASISTPTPSRPIRAGTTPSRPTIRP